MYININDDTHEVIIEKKPIKNMYMRIKSDSKIYITAPIFTPNKMIDDFITKNEKFIVTKLAQIKAKNKYNDKLSYLGKYYDIVYTNSNIIEFGDYKAFVGKNTDLDKFYKKMAKIEFSNRLNKIYDEFNKSVPYPNMRIRKMTTRWGVCNNKLKTITLNQELIKYGYDAIDYVIVHELCHFIEMNHSKNFWDLVSYYCPNYKKVRKELKD